MMKVLLKSYPLQASFVGGFSCFLVTAFAQAFPFFGLAFGFLATLPLYIIGLLLGRTYGVLAAFIAFGCHFLYDLNAGIHFATFSFFPYLIVLYSALPERGKKLLPLSRILSRVIVSALFYTVGATFLIQFMGISIKDYIFEIILRAQQPHLVESFEPLITFLPAFISLSCFANCAVCAWFAYRIRVPASQRIRFLPPFQQTWDIVLVAGLILDLSADLINVPTFKFFSRSIMLYSALYLGSVGSYVVYRFLQKRQIKRGVFFAASVLSFLLVWPLIIVVVLGFVEPWYGFSKIKNENSR